MSLCHRQLRDKRQFFPGRQVPHRVTCFVDFLAKELQVAERKVFAALGTPQKKKRASKG